ncbi:MAG: leucyl aminopeptidase [Chloroflexota bacterium]|nr:leucyl aminopeptidase [Chloroflexota bacterium]
MDLQVHATQSDLNADTVLIAVYFDDDDLSSAGPIRQIGGSTLERMIQRGEVKSRLYDISVVHSDGSGPALLLIGAGNRDELEPLTRMRLAAAASRHATGRGWRSLAVLDRGTGSPTAWAAAITAGVVTGAYNADLMKTNKESKRQLDRLLLLSERSRQEGFARAAEIGQIGGESVNLARDLVNLPPNELTPRRLAQRAEDLAKQYGLRSEIHDEHKMRELGMGSLLGVAAGSQEPPRLIVLQYGDSSADNRIAFVGKGLTFDSGGLSLKTGEGMMTMKSDMGGAAAVIAGMVAIGRLGLKNVAVTGYAGATENMPGGAAMRPGDVVTAMNGETIEVLNTDAEGRLVLADVLSYAVSRGEKHIVDFATLTGSAVVALGHAATLATGKPRDWVWRVVQAADRGFDRSWPMPLYSEYRKDMDSEVADIKNVGGRAGSALTASAFLGDFVQDANWTHMDIAGTAWNGESLPYAAKGGTGAGVGTVISLALEMAGE